MQLYQIPISHYCAKVRIALLEKGLGFELPDLPGGSPRSDAFYDLNPLGQVPVLVDGDVVVRDSEVILAYLEDTYPQPPLLPEDPAERARCRWLCRLHDLQVAPAVSRLYRALTEGAPDSALAEDVASLTDLLVMVEAEVRPTPWLLGGLFSAADCALAVSFAYACTLSGRAGHPLEIHRLPKLKVWQESVVRRPSVATVLDDIRQAMAGGAEN